MRGGDAKTEALVSYVSCERRVPVDHPSRPIQKIVDAALTALSAEFQEAVRQAGAAADCSGETAAGFRKTRHRGFARVGWMLNLTATAYNLVRLPKLVETAA